MSIDIKVPTVGESISEVTLVKWIKEDGAWADRDEVIAELESEKATFEINAEQAGAVKQVAKEGDTLAIGDLVATIDTDAAKPEGSAKPAEEAAPKAAAAAPKEDPKDSALVSASTAAAAAVKATPVAAAILGNKKVGRKK